MGGGREERDATFRIVERGLGEDLCFALAE